MKGGNKARHDCPDTTRAHDPHSPAAPGFCLPSAELAAGRSADGNGCADEAKRPSWVCHIVRYRAGPGAGAHSLAPAPFHHASAPSLVILPPLHAYENPPRRGRARALP